jgi:hypothetical protein
METLAHPSRVTLDALVLTARQTDELQEEGDAFLLLAGLDPIELREVLQVVER